MESKKLQHEEEIIKQENFFVIEKIKENTVLVHLGLLKLYIRK
jgi:hypothetical protein